MQCLIVNLEATCRKAGGSMGRMEIIEIGETAEGQAPPGSL